MAKYGAAARGMGVITWMLAAGCGAAAHSGPAIPAPIDAGSTPVVTAPPAPPRETIDLGEIEVKTAPVLFTYAPEPDAAAIARPLLSREGQRKWGAFEAALRESNDPLHARMNEAARREVVRSARHPMCGDDESVSFMPPDPIVLPEAASRTSAPSGSAPNAGARAIDLRADLMKQLERDLLLPAEVGAASLVALAYIEEIGPPGAPATPDEDAARRERAASLYQKAKAKVSLDTPLGFVARLRLAEVESGAEAASELGALLGVDLASAQMRAWVRSLAAHRLPDYVKAAGVFRAIALSAETPADKIGARAEWLVATYDAGNWRAALDLAIVMLRDAAHDVPHVAFDVAAASIARLGGVEHVAIDLPPAPFATLMHHIAARALREGDWATADRAARSLLDRAPDSAEAPAATWLALAVRALRGDAAAEAERAAKVSSFAPKSPWADRVRASRGGRHGFPSDAQIGLFSATIAQPLPHAPSTDEARLVDLRARTEGLSARCIATTADSGDPGEAEVRIGVTVHVFADRDAEIEVAPPADATGITRAIACLGANGARFFRDAPASAHAVLAVSR